MPPKKPSGSDVNGGASSSRNPPKNVVVGAKTAKGYKRAEKVPENYIIEDTVLKKQWRVGNLIGQGGFADVYTVTDAVSKSSNANAKNVIKIEPKENGPLFQEIHFFKAAAKKSSITSFMSRHNMKSLGMMEYIGSGSFDMNYKELRWLILPRLGRNVQEILNEMGGRFSRDCVIKLGIQMMDILEYIHSQGYAHADIKASNMMTGLGKSEANQIYLIDFGLVKKFLPEGKHIEYVENPKAAHDGTLAFTSLDAHKGAAPTRRGDMQILGFNLISWLVGSLPWSDIDDANYVRSLKTGYMADLGEFFRVAFPDSSNGPPKEISEYFREIKNLEYKSAPKYDELRGFFQKAFKEAKFRKSDLFTPPEVPAENFSVKKPSTAKSVGDRASTSTATEVISKRSSKAVSEVLDRDIISNGLLKTKATKAKPASKKTKVEVSDDDSDEEGMSGNFAKPLSDKKLKTVKDETESDEESSEDEIPVKIAKSKNSLGHGDDGREVDLSKLPPGKRFKARAAMKEAVEQQMAGTSSFRIRPQRSAAAGKSYTEEAADVKVGGRKKAPSKRAKKDDDNN